MIDVTGNNAAPRDVVIQDSTSPLFQYFLMRELKTDITLTADVSIGDEEINVSASHGFVADPGEQIVLFENSRVLQVPVKSVSTNEITISEPSTIGFSVANAVVLRGNILMNVDGTTPVDYILNLRDFTIPIDVSKIIITMQHGSNVGDDGKFGGLSALANGLFFMKEDGSTFSLGNYRENQDFKDVGGKVEYTAKAPAGLNATDITFDIKEIFGQVIRIDPRLPDIITGTVRDDIDAGSGMSKLTTSLIGSYTVGE